jgi:hypothetical protein
MLGTAATCFFVLGFERLLRGIGIARHRGDEPLPLDRDTSDPVERLLTRAEDASRAGEHIPRGLQVPAGQLKGQPEEDG